MQRELLQDQLAARLMHEIWTRRWPVGSMLPRELELCKSEGVSRFTVRAAMKKLESAGLIRRTPHVGTMVVSTGQAKSLNRELENQGKCTCDGRVIKRYFHERYGLDELNASARRGA